jgi:hypothetical protein
MVDSETVVEKINADLAVISDWSLRNMLRLNSQKSQAMAIFRKLPECLVFLSVISNVSKGHISNVTQKFVLKLDVGLLLGLFFQFFIIVMLYIRSLH